LLISYKPHPSDNTLSLLDNYADKLDIEVMIQSQGYIEESMNMIFKTARDYDILLLLDDDSVPSKDWVKQHVYLHSIWNTIGIIGGRIEPSPSIPSENRFFKIFRRYLGYYKPLYEIFHNYISYVNKMGLSVGFNQDIVNMGYNKIQNLNDLLEKKNFVLSSAYGLGGANMSIKSPCIRNFEFPCATLRGIGYERCLTTHITNMGFHSVLVNSCEVEHLDRDSLSRPKSNIGFFAIILEEHVQPYLINTVRKIDLQSLKSYNVFIKSYSAFRHTIRSKAYVRGLNIAIKAIEEQWTSTRVRDAIQQEINAYRNIQINNQRSYS